MDGKQWMRQDALLHGGCAHGKRMKKEPVRFTLRAARTLRGLTQAQAAELIGISVNTLSHYESGKSYPDVPTLQQIERVYAIGYDQLFFPPRQ